MTWKRVTDLALGPWTPSLQTMRKERLCLKAPQSMASVRTAWTGWQDPKGPVLHQFCSWLRSHSKNPHRNSALGSESVTQVDVPCRVHGTFSGRSNCSDGPASLPESGTALKGHFGLLSSLWIPWGPGCNCVAHPCRRQAKGAPQRVRPRESYRDRALPRIFVGEPSLTQDLPQGGAKATSRDT